jgi:hypothetical protein
MRNQAVALIKRFRNVIQGYKQTLGIFRFEYAMRQSALPHYSRKAADAPKLEEMTDNLMKLEMLDEQLTSSITY